MSVKEIKLKNIILKYLVLFIVLMSTTFYFINSNASNNPKVSTNIPHYALVYSCGGPSQTVITSINFGCQQKGNGILDLLFAIIRFLSDGVGLVIILSIIIAGIQYISSSGDPQTVSKAVARIRSSIIALIIYIFAYAILNYLIPGAVLK